MDYISHGLHQSVCFPVLIALHFRKIRIDERLEFVVVSWTLSVCLVSSLTAFNFRNNIISDRLRFVIKSVLFPVLSVLHLRNDRICDRLIQCISHRVMDLVCLLSTFNGVVL